MLPSDYTAILYCTLFQKFIDRRNTLELERSFDNRLAQTDTSLLSLLLALVASMVLPAPPPPARVLLGWHPEPGTSAEVRVPALCLPCLASLVPSLSQTWPFACFLES